MDANGDATVTFTEWADFLRPIAALAKPEPFLSYLSPYSSWRYRGGYWPYSSYYHHDSYHLNWRHSYLPSWRDSYYSSWRHSSLYRPYYRSYLSSYVPPAPVAPAYVAPAYVAPAYVAPAYVPPARTVWPAVTYSAPRYTHTTYEPAGTVTEYVPETVTTMEPVTTYSTRVVPDYKLVTERTEYVTTPVRSSLYYGSYGYAGYAGSYGYAGYAGYGGYASNYYSRYHW
jgi:hypothetical protein